MRKSAGNKRKHKSGPRLVWYSGGLEGEQGCPVTMGHLGIKDREVGTSSKLMVLIARVQGVQGIKYRVVKAIR